jgi:hypothetical protein
VQTTFDPSLATLPQERQLRSQQAPTPAAEARPALQTLLGAIRLDCLDQPERYLEEISVPLGGE